MAITEIQHQSATGSDTAPRLPWTQPTQAGNLQVAVITWSIDGGNATLTMEAGKAWKLAKETYVSGKVRQAIYYRISSTGADGKVKGTLSAARRWNIATVEVNSSTTGWILDQTASATGSSTSPSTGTTPVTSTTTEYWVAGFSAFEKATLSSPTSSFVILEQITNDTGVCTALTSRIAAVASSVTTGGTYDVSAHWIGAVATFMSAPQTITGAGAALVGEGSLSAYGYYREQTLIVQAAFGYGAADPDPRWTDISSYVRTCSWQRGRQNELNQMAAGTATVVLNDVDSHWDSRNPDSPFYPNVKPGLPVRAALYVGAKRYPLFYGFAERLPRTERIGDIYTQRQLDLTDGFALLAAAGVGGYTYGEQTSDARVNAVLNDIGWPERDRRIGVGASTMQEKEFAGSDDTRAQQHLNNVADSENGLLFVDGAKNLVFIGRHELLLDDRYTIPRASFGDAQAMT